MEWLARCLTSRCLDFWQQIDQILKIGRAFHREVEPKPSQTQLRSNLGGQRHAFQITFHVGTIGLPVPGWHGSTDDSPERGSHPLYRSQKAELYQGIHVFDTRPETGGSCEHLLYSLVPIEKDEQGALAARNVG